MATYAPTAQRLAAHFSNTQRDTGEWFTTFQCDEPDHTTLIDMTFAASQAGIDTDDAYEMVANALQQIADTDPDDIADTDRDGRIEIYNAPLMRWLSRNWSLADDMKDEYGQWPDTMTDIAQATQDYAYGLVFGAIAANWPESSDDTERA